MLDPQNNFKDSYLESKLLYQRTIIVLLFIFMLLASLLIRTHYLQITEHQHFVTLSKNNRIKITSQVPTRGLIYDRKGHILAENIPVYSLELIPEQVPDMALTLKKLQTLLAISEDEMNRFKKLSHRSKRFVSTPLRLRMNEKDIALFAAKRPHYPGVDIHAHLTRHYPYAELTAHVVGYVGRINIQELKQLDPVLYQGSYYIGKTGIEKTYEKSLHGIPGYQQTETNVVGRQIHQLNNTPSIPGTNLQLTLDIDLQKTAYEALSDYTGALVALNPQNGAVLALVSKPGFDPNPFVYGISHKAYKALQNAESLPLINRAMRGQSPPGSTVKPFIGLAGLENSAINPRTSVYCPGFYRLPNVNHRYRDWKKSGHGHTALQKAITQSCDVYFYNLAHSLGIDRLSNFLYQFGFGQKTGIDITGEKSGLLPSKAWKRKNRNQAWYPGETLITGIGQGFFQVTPLQLAKATAMMANRGLLITPHIVKQVQPNSIERLPIQSKHWDTAIAAMINVVHGKRGTARRIGKNSPYTIAGKTGTAQVFTVKQDEKYRESEIAKKLRDHALFISFAPAENPTIAIAIIVENGGHGGSVAAPIAAKVMQQYLQSDL